MVLGDTVLQFLGYTPTVLGDTVLHVGKSMVAAAVHPAPQPRVRERQTLLPCWIYLPCAAQDPQGVFHLSSPNLDNASQTYPWACLWSF